MFYIFLTEPEPLPISLHVHIPGVEGVNKGENTVLKEGPALTARGEGE